ncbi:MAG: TetR/AcrR family transcriptional regulator [Vicingaceae bacterium]
MKDLLTSFSIQVCEKLYLKDPESSELGKRILKGSIDQIQELGFEQFTFRKLASEIESTEASIYRYFESKHKVLLYLTSWYWSWMEYRLVFQTANIPSPEERLNIAIRLITENVDSDQVYPHINEAKLHQIVVSESTKAFMTKEVDQENKEGAFIQYKHFVGRISDLVKEINTKYKYPHMLISTVIEGAHLQRHFAAHLPRLTDQIKGEDAVVDFYQDIVFKAIQKDQTS